MGEEANQGARALVTGQPAGARSLAVLAALPALVPAVILLFQLNGRYLPFGDQAVLEMHVREVGVHPVLLGPYSRFGFSHPGPLGAYLLAGPYRLLGRAHEALAFGTLLLSAVCLAGCAWIVRARLGLASALWAVVVLMVTIRLLEPGFLRDSWNPYLPVLPLLLAVLLCWVTVTGTPGSRSVAALPAAVVLMSLAVQSHVGFLAPVGATLAVTGSGLLGQWWRNRRAGRATGTRRLVATVALSLGVTLLAWLAPLIQQLTGHPPNGSALLHYLRTAQSDSTVRLGLRAVADELAKLPSYVAGVRPPEHPLLPLQEPLWAAAVGLFAVVVAVAVAWRRKRHDLLWLAAFTVAVGVAGVSAVSRIQGLAFPYVTAWTSVVGALAWILVGATLLPELGRLITARPASRATVKPLRSTATATATATVVGAGLALVAVAGLTVATVRAPTPQTDYTGELTDLSSAVRHDLVARGMLGPNGSAVVRVDFAPTSRPVIVGTSFPGSGLVLDLVGGHVDVQVAPFWQSLFDRRYVERVDQARYVVTLAYADGSSPPPAAGQRVLATAGEYQVYGGPTVP